METDDLGNPVSPYNKYEFEDGSQTVTISIRLRHNRMITSKYPGSQLEHDVKSSSGRVEVVSLPLKGRVTKWHSDPYPNLPDCVFRVTKYKPHEVMVDGGSHHIIHDNVFKVKKLGPGHYLVVCSMVGCIALAGWRG